MSENAELARHGIERIAEGHPAWELYSPDFQLTNIANAPWQPSPGPKGIQEWIDFADEVSEEWGLAIEGLEELDSGQVLATLRVSAKFRATGIRDELKMTQVITFAGGKM